MSLHSRLPVEATLDDRVTAINLLCDKLAQRGTQIERLRWRVAIELYAVQKIVLAEGLAWEAWCEAHINRGLRDIRKLLKMAMAHDPEAAHGAEKAGTKAARRKKGNGADQRPSMAVRANAKQTAKAVRQLMGHVLSCCPISEARALLELVEISDLIAFLDEAEAAAALTGVAVVSITTH